MPFSLYVVSPWHVSFVCHMCVCVYVYVCEHWYKDVGLEGEMYVCMPFSLYVVFPWCVSFVCVCVCEHRYIDVGLQGENI